MLFGNTKEKEHKQFQELKRDYKGRIGPMQGLEYLKKRFNIIINREELTTIFCMDDTIKNSLTSAEIDNFILVYILDAGVPHKTWDYYEQFMNGGKVTFGSTTVQASGYTKLWKVIAPDDTDELKKW